MSSVDVVVPCYNYARYLEGCVNSVLNQRDVDVRVLIVDDASPDATPEVAGKLVSSDRRVSYLRNAVNLGLTATANRGVIDWARAEYTALVSADDALTPGSFARAVQVMNSHPEVGMTYGMAVVISNDYAPDKVDDIQLPNHRILSGPEFLKRTCGHGICLASPSALVRTSIQKQVGGYNSSFPHSCDLEMWMRIATRSSIAVVDAPQAFYRWHGQNMSTRFIYRPTSDLQDQLATAIHVYKNWGPDIPEFPHWIERMKLKFADQACWMAGLAVERTDRAGMEDCIAFAAQNNPNLWRSKAWWRYRAKRILGGSLTRSVRNFLKPNAPQYDLPFAMFAPFKLGETFGWWPEKLAGRQ
jgi:glycosyltransferase involved in cell wall biosynthesis